MNAAEHFAWAKERAMEYVKLGDAGSALSSITLDLDRHPGTAHIMNADLQMLAMGEAITGGVGAVGRFIEGIPVPIADGGRS